MTNKEEMAKEILSILQGNKEGDKSLQVQIDDLTDKIRRIEDFLYLRMGELP